MEKPFVLLADDNEATCTLITALLHKDFVVDIARDGDDAIERLKSRHYAAILLDLLMPVADGYAVLDFLRSENEAALSKVIVVTAALSSRDVQRMRNYRVFAVISKPFEVDTLQAAVKECADPGGESLLRGPFLTGGMLLLLADLLRRV